MKYFYSLIILFLISVTAIAQPLPIMRNAMSTNVAGTPVLSQNDLSVTNSVLGGTTNWLFYGILTQTVARLGDVWGSTGSVSLLAVTNVITGFGPNMFIIITNGVGTNTTFYATNYYGTNVFSPAASFVGGVLISNSVVTNQLVGGATNLYGLIIIGTNAGFYADGGDGDITGSGHLTSLDITAIKTWIAGSSSSDTYLTNAAALARADVTGDGIVNMSDVFLLRPVILGLTNLVDFRHAYKRIFSGTIGINTNRFFVIGTKEMVDSGRENVEAKLEIISTNHLFSDFMINTNEFVVSNHLTTANGSVDIYTNLAVRGSNYVAGQSYFGNTVYVDGPGSGLEVDAITITNATTNLGAFYIKNNAISNALLRCTNSTTGQATWDNNYLNATEVSNLVSSVAYGQTWFVWGSSNTLATNAAGTPYKAMLKGDTPLPSTANTNTYTTPTAGQYVGEVITAIPAGISLIVPGDIVTESFAYLSENRTMVLQPEIYIRTNMIAPSFSALGEREVAVGPSFTVNNTFQSFAVNIPVTTNIVLSTTNYLVRKLRVVSVSGGTPNLLLVSQDGYPARVTFPIASSSFVLKSGDVMGGTLVLTNSYNVGKAFSSSGTNIGAEQFGTNSIAGSNYSLAIGGAQALAGSDIAIGFGSSTEGTNGVAIGFEAGVDPGKYNGVAIGRSATSSGSNSVALGPFAQAADDSQIKMGIGDTAVNVPGFLELPIGAAVGSIWQCTNATTGRGQWNATQYKSVWIDAGAMATNATGGPTVGYYTATNFDGIYSDVWDYDSLTPQTNYFKLMMPDSWDLGTVKVKFYYFTTAVAASTSNVWAVCAQAINPGDLFGFRGTEVQVTNLVQDTTNKLNMCISPAITVGGTPTLGNMVHFQIRRVADSGWDNSAGNARLLGVAIQWNDKRSNPTIW